MCASSYYFYSNLPAWDTPATPSNYLVFIFPRGITAVTGDIGRSEPLFLGSELSFLGFLAIFSLR